MSLRNLAVAVAIAVGMCEVSWAQLTGQYLFEEGPGSTAIDSSGFARHGTNINGPAYVPGLYPGSEDALLLNSNGPSSPNIAAGQFVSLPANSNFVRAATGVTLMAWIRLDGAGPADRTILSISNGTSITGGQRAELRVSDFLGTPRALISGNNIDSNTASGQLSLSSLTLGQTHFVAGVLDYVNGSAAIYVDGEQEGFSVVPGWSGASLDTANLVAKIGATIRPSPAFNQNFFPGAIDGARIFARALSSGEIQHLYQSPNAIPEPAAALLAGCGLMAIVVSSGRLQRRVAG